MPNDNNMDQGVNSQRIHQIPKEILDEARELTRALLVYQNEYYVLQQPSVSDKEFDHLFDRLVHLEFRYPQLKSPDSPTQRVGSDVTADFPEFKHTIPVLSLDKAYSLEELETWVGKLEKQGAEGFVIEEKLDGASLVLYYQNGVLDRAVTRGNGEVGNDITANVKTIRSVPLRLPEPLSGPVRGEVYLLKTDFIRLNSQLQVPYSNPRNLAAGTLRRIKSSEVARIPLKISIYESFFGDSQRSSHWENLQHLKALGFPVSPRTKLIRGTGLIQDLDEYVRSKTQDRSQLDYEIDGLVLKVDDLDLRDRLGYTGHHPRWALAYKFESPQGVSRVLEVDVQIGRTGRATPVARIEPVEVGGARITNVTLHNQDYIHSLELSVGDTVSVSRRGDVIPAIEGVLDKADIPQPVWEMPSQCPSCTFELEKLGAHHFCTNFDCSDRQRGRLTFFVGRDQMDIQGLGAETVDLLWKEGILKDIPDIYHLPYEKILNLPGFGQKKVDLLKKGIQDSKSQPYQRVLPSLGIPDLGPKAAELLITHGFLSIQSLFEASEKNPENLSQVLLDIKGLGEKTVQRIMATLRDTRFRTLVEQLKGAGLQFYTDEPVVLQEGPFLGQVWCVTGSFQRFKPRETAMEEVKKLGGLVVGDVSSKTTHLLAGEKSGSKLTKAQSLGVQIVNEADFLQLLGWEY